MSAPEKRWPAQEAKAKFSALLRAARKHGPQVVTLRGQDEAVLVPMREWLDLKGPRFANVRNWLLAPAPRAELALPPRRKWRRRAPVKFD